MNHDDPKSVRDLFDPACMTLIVPSTAETEEELLEECLPWVAWLMDRGASVRFSRSRDYGRPRWWASIHCDTWESSRKRTRNAGNRVEVDPLKPVDGLLDARKATWESWAGTQERQAVTAGAVLDLMAREDVTTKEKEAAIGCAGHTYRRRREWLGKLCEAIPDARNWPYELAVREAVDFERETRRLERCRAQYLEEARDRAEREAKWEAERVGSGSVE